MVISKVIEKQASEMSLAMDNFTGSALTEEGVLLGVVRSVTLYRSNSPNEKILFDV
jgi:hypothetical protein